MKKLLVAAHILSYAAIIMGAAMVGSGLTLKAVFG